MPKALVLSNGNLLIGFDKTGQVRDFFFPYVGMENHTAGRQHRIGIWVDNRFSWISDSGWVTSINYSPDSLTGNFVATNDGLGIKLESTDVIYNEKDIFIREVKVTNLSDHPRLVKLFFHQQFEIYESYRKDTAYFDPAHHVVIHYKGRRVFLINARQGDQAFDDYSVGLFSIENREGTYKDAEDGSLSKNAIEHGPVDSVIGLSLNLDAGQFKQVHYWIAVSKYMNEVQELNRYILDKTPAYLIQTTHNFWLAWVNRQPLDFQDLPPEVVSLFKRSLLLIRTHADNRGAIIASCDSDMLQYGRDTYSYVWPRDGALSAIALDAAGDHDVSHRFFEFCHSVISEDGYFMHKYRSDQALGSSWHPWVRNNRPQLPIQEDETALVLVALWRHYQSTKDLEFIENIYQSLVKKAAEFMLSYRDPRTGLPLPSYDIWEEKYGVSTFTSSAVYAALNAASKFAELLGKIDTANKYRAGAKEIKEGILTHLYDQKDGYFYKNISYDTEPKTVDHTIDVSSVYGIFKYEILPPDDERLTRAISLTMSRLGLPTMVGGVARYEGDQYYRNDSRVPGNPWFIATLWLAQYYLTQAKQPEDTAMVKRFLQWATHHTMPSGILSEQLDPNSGDQLSAAPLTWSHSEYVVTVLEYLSKNAQLRSK